MRSVLGVVAGFVAANAAMLAITSANALLYPEIARAVATGEQAALEAAVAATPGAAGALLVTWIAWACGSLLGGWLATKLAHAESLAPALTFAAIFLLGAIANNLQFPPPLWFWVATPFAFLPPAAAGAKLELRSRAATPRA